ncbi:MAG: hypothetical protein QHI48_11110 [Bacteroidota bacterium]|nr:hypothetical protein [Bacteroidota bacterium]
MNRILFACAVAGALLAAGCGAEPEFPSAPVSGLVTIRNLSSVTFHVLRFRPQSQIDWSKDYLDRNTVISPSTTVSYYMPVGTFDFLLENITDEVYVEFKDVVIWQGEETTLTVRD